jgi:hypothetical protein
MRTTKSIVTFRAPFTLNANVGELPAGTYDIEVDEVESLTGEHVVYRRLETLLIVRSSGSVRTLSIDAEQLESALQHDLGRTAKG